MNTKKINKPRKTYISWTINFDNMSYTIRTINVRGETS